MRVFLRFSFNCILAFLGGPREARGRLTAPAAFTAAAALRAAERASRAQVYLCSCLVALHFDNCAWEHAGAENIVFVDQGG